jgi:hypothetical protein
MGLFDFGDSVKENSSESEFATPNKQAQIRKQSGFDNISDVAKAAPEKIASEQTTSSIAPARTRKLSKLDKEEQERQEKLEKKRKAIKTLGRRYAKWLAENPYKMWSAFADDDFLALTKEESQELTEMYFELAEALEPDLTSWYVIVFGILAMNASLVTVRLKHIKALEEDNPPPPMSGSPLPTTIDSDEEEEETQHGFRN